MVDYTKKPYAYRLQAIHPVEPGKAGLATACVMSCCVSGKMLSGMGGGGSYISPEVYDLLQHDKEVQALIRQKLVDVAQTSK